MEILDYIKGQNDDWLIGSVGAAQPRHRFYFQQLFEKFYLELLAYKTPQKILLAERQPVRFLAGFIAACAANCPVFLCNPDWGKQEWEEVFNLVQPNLILGNSRSQAEPGNAYRDALHHTQQITCLLDNERQSLSCKRSQPEPGNEEFQIHNWIMIPTGGSSGKIKFVIHTWGHPHGICERI